MVWRETGKDSALWRNYWDLLRWRLGKYPRRWSRTREGAGRSSRRIHRLLATFLRAKEVRLSSTTGPALSFFRTTRLISGRVPRPGHVIKLSIFPFKNSTIIGTWKIASILQYQTLLPKLFLYLKKLHTSVSLLLLSHYIQTRFIICFRQHLISRSYFSDWLSWPHRRKSTSKEFVWRVWVWIRAPHQAVRQRPAYWDPSEWQHGWNVFCSRPR